MDTGHQTWARTVAACVDGELSGAQNQATGRHLEQCPGCEDHATVLLAVRSSPRRVVHRLPVLSARRLERLAAHLHRREARA